MAQRVINGEQYEALLIRGDLNGGPVPVAFASGVTISGVTLGAEVEVTNDSGNPLPISAASLPLPTGAATEAKQDTLIGHVDGVEGLLSTIDADTSSIDGKLPALSSGRIPVEIGAITLGDVEIKNDSGNPVPVSDGGGSLTVDAASLPLPTGAATEAKQDTLIGHVDGVEGLLGTIDTDTGSIDGKLPSGLTVTNDRLKVDGSVAVRTPTTTSVTSSATSVTILASNANRRGISIANDSTQVLRLSYATPATTANAFIVMQPGSFLWLDQQLMITSTIYGIWASANGTAQVTEYV